MYQHQHLGVYALVTSAAGRVLLIRKARGPYIGLWDLPGGSPDFGETPPQTLCRELLEETGLAAEGERFVTVLSFVHKYSTAAGQPAALHHFGILYALTADEAAPLKTSGDGEDSHGAQWFNPAALPPLSPLAQHAMATQKEKSPRTEIRGLKDP